MQALQYYVVDVFAEKKFEGNQLAVFRGAEGLTDVQMLAITREMNYSESAFVMKDDQENNGYRVRIFTPGAEVPFAGHPTLGTAYIIAQFIKTEPVETIFLNLEVGQIEVTMKRTNNQPDTLWMKQKEPTFSRTLSHEMMADMLQIDVEDLDVRFPIEEVSTGLPVIIVPMKRLADVKKCKVNADKYAAFIETSDAKMIHVFCPETYQIRNQINTRNFGEYFGIPEDPATGSANGCLAGYLVKHRYFGESRIDIGVEQGYEINRPSQLYLRAHQISDTIDIYVGGRVQMVAEGTFYI